MDGSSERPNSDLAPLTVAHGRKLFNQGKAIATMLDQLKPLLEEQETKPTDDPVMKIVELLTIISMAQQEQVQHQQMLDRKLDFLIAHLTESEQLPV